MFLRIAVLTCSVLSYASAGMIGFGTIVTPHPGPPVRETLWSLSIAGQGPGDFALEGGLWGHSFLSCAGTCTSGSLAVEIASNDPDYLAYGSGTVNGVYYSQLTLSDLGFMGGTTPRSDLHLETIEFTITGAGTYQVPFSIYPLAPGFPSVLQAGYPTGGGLGGQYQIVLDSPVLVGSGLATINLIEPAPGVYVSDLVTWTFVPEPGTFSLMVAAPIALVLARRLRHIRKTAL